MKKKRKLKLLPKICLIIILLLTTFLIIDYIFKDKKVNLGKNKIDNIYHKVQKENISLEFISWVDKNYPDSIERLDKLLKENDYDKKFWHEATGYSYLVLDELYNNKYEKMDNLKIVDKKESTISIVGDVSLADNWAIMPQYDSRGKKVLGILSEDILKIMKSTDVMIANSEFTVSKRGAPLKGKLYTFRAKPSRLSIYDEMGVDLVTLANNHVYDFGKDAFLDMLDSFKEYKIPYIGAGINYEEASKPYYFIVNGYKIAFLNGTRAEKYIMTPEATKTNPGVFRCYDTTNMKNKIKEVKETADYTIVIMHFGREGSHDLEKEQVSSAKEYLDSGADVIVGHHAHTLQGVEFYKDKPIIYNLGNFIFNDETIDTAIFQIKLFDDGKMEYYMIPALQKNEYTDILTGKAKQRVIDDLNSWSINAEIDKNGKINQVK